MELVQIKKTLEENEEFLRDPLCEDIIKITVDFYQRVGFAPPWIGYIVKQNGIIAGSAGFKGSPVNGKVEIAYGTFENFREQGIGTAICKALVKLSLKTNPSIKITARTLTENIASSRILEKNNFKFIGMIEDPEDGQVMEWEYVTSSRAV